LKNKLDNNFLFLTIGRFSAAGIQAIFYLLFAKLLGPTSYGELGFFISLAGLTSLFCRFGLTYTVTVFGSKKNYKFTDEINTISAITTGLGALILLPINEFAALLSLGISYFAMNQHNLLGKQKYKKYMYVTILKNVLAFVLPVLFYFVLDISGILLGLALGNILLSYDFIKTLKKNISFSNTKQHFKIIIHNFGVDINSNLPRFIDRIIIASLFGFTNTGIYQFNMQILFAMELLPRILHLFLLSKESNNIFQKKIIYYITIISVFFSILTIILAPIIIPQLFPKYSDGITSLQILSLSIIPLSLSSIFTAKLQVKESTKVGFTAIVRLSSLVISLILFGNLFGLIGFSLAVLLSTSLNFLYLGYLYKNLIKN